MKYVINKDLFIDLKKNTSQYKIPDVINIPFFIRCRRRSIIAAVTFPHKEDWQGAELVMGKEQASVDIYQHVPALDLGHY